jgi:hypothetical protein
MNKASPHDNARALVWARYELTLDELDQLATDPRVISLIELYEKTLVHLADFHDVDHEEIGTGFWASLDDVGEEAEPTIAVAGLSFLDALDCYAEDVLGYLPEERSRGDVQEEIDDLREGPGR